MAEAAFKQMIATFVRQTRPQSFRHSKPLRYPQRCLTTTAGATPQPIEPETPQWQAHTVQPSVQQTRPERRRLDQLRTESEPRTFSSFLTDNYSREHNYLRISVTERCNLRCLYCMPEEGVPLSPSAKLLTTPEIVYLSELFVNQGVNKIRLTGGEPTVRKDIVDLMQQIGNLRKNGLKELCITTNGISLARKLDSMVESGLTGVNLSLDTLDPYQFTIMTRRNGHDAVMKSINRILEMNKLGAGIKLKINCVVMRGLNEREILPFVELGREQDLEVRFIEYMPFDGNKWSEKKMMSFGEMLALIRQKYPDVYKVGDHKNDTSKTYAVPGFAGRIGFITSMTHNFCGTCNRLRITGDGNLKVCLFGNEEVSLRDILRQSNNGNPIDAEAMEAIKQIEMDRRQNLSVAAGQLGVSEKEANLLDVIGMAVKQKKEKHAGLGELENMKNRPMILIDDAFPKLPTSMPSGAPSFPRPTHHSSVARPYSVPLHLLSFQATPRSWSRPCHTSSYSSSSDRTSRRNYSQSARLLTWLRHSSFRFVRTQQDYRKVPAKTPDNVPGYSSITWPETRQRKAQAIAKAFRLKIQATYVQNLSRQLVKRRIRYRAKKLNPYPPQQQLRHVSSSSRQSKDDPPKLSHLTATGEAHMVDISGKTPTKRSATATTVLLFSHPETYGALLAARLRKGDAISVARIAGIQAAKKTADLIPLAHPGLSITGASVQLEPFVGDTLPYPFTRNTLGLQQNLQGGVVIIATVSCDGKTGVEMEAMTSASVAGLTMYDMLKAVDKAMVLTATRVTAKSGGKSGDWRWDPSNNKIVKDETAAETEALEHEHEVIQAQKAQDCVRQKQLEIDVGVSPPPRNRYGTVYKRGRVDSTDFMHGRQERFAHYLEARGSVLSEQGQQQG
ncbi:molybdenum cofactor biosynthesis protein A [Exophiala sideris]|uniref:Molybdenum cofactor biosynthesis protein A n=1 Tax=Exophiala sideris TaxID=1016849 RepID=A0A0D1YES4_9EURO|nr:molybdenum cofactor biosynthesis protein A [Exophiala sideris]